MMVHSIIRVLLTLMVVVLSSVAAEAPSTSTETMQGSSWTIMVYMADDTTSSLDWEDDINEMEAVQLVDDVRIIALVDPFGPNNSRVYRVENDPNMFDPAIVSSRVNDSGTVIIDDEVDMASPLTLESFVEFAASAYPSDYNVLVLWGHGAGWRGLCPDGTDLLTLPELSQALDGATTTMGRPLDLLVIDSCVGASLEALWEVHESVRFLVGSEKDVPFQGLPYDIVLADLTEDSHQRVEDFATTIADEYRLWSASNTDYSVTMGVFDLSRMAPLVDALEILSIQGSKYDSIFHNTLKTALGNSETYEDASSVDFQHFVWQLQNSDLPLEIRYAAHQCLLAVQDVVYHFTRYSNPRPVDGVAVANASGFTIHASSDGTTDEAYANLSLAASSWQDFGRLLRSNTLPIPNGLGPSVSYESVDSPNDSAVIAWPNGTQYGSIWIFRNQTGGLTLTSVLNSSSQVVRLTDMAGRLALATSSFINGSLSSYRTVNVTLYGTVSIKVKLMIDGDEVDSLDDNFEISLTTARDGSVLPSAQPSQGDSFYSINVRIPDDAMVGDIVTIRVTDKSNGEPVGARRISIPSTSPSDSIALDLASRSKSSDDYFVPLLFAVLPGLLILAFAFSLYFEPQNRRRGPGKAS